MNSVSNKPVFLLIIFVIVIIVNNAFANSKLYSYYIYNIIFNDL